MLLEEEEELQDEEPPVDEAAMKAFEENVKTYWAEREDYEGTVEDKVTFDRGMVVPEDFAYLTNLEALRLMSCQQEIHSLKFLESLEKLKVLEIGEVRLDDLDGLDKLLGLEKLCVWTN